MRRLSSCAADCANFTRHIEDLRAWFKPVQLHWITTRPNVKGNKEADVAANCCKGNYGMEESRKRIRK